MRRAAIYGTVIALAHFLITIVHGFSHARLGIELDLFGNIFVMVVVVLSPLVALPFLWTARQRFGLALLALSMGGALLFGLYHHFLVMGPDHVGEQVPGVMAGVFAASAYGILISEALGTFCGLFYWLKRGSRSRENLGT